MKNMETKRSWMRIPKYIEFICSALEDAGFPSYAVGGCIRDLLLGKVPQDYDVASAAWPRDVKAIFPKTIDTGLSHGTVTVILPEGKAEVTTFRRDGEYTDRRRPDRVSFVTDIEEDLARRDFTVNAMAFSPSRGFYDPFDGRIDMEREVLRTVGKPEKRFTEDALRILRLFRFSAQLSFRIEEETAVAAYSLADSLTFLSRERIFSETDKLLHYADAAQLSAAVPVLSIVMPEVDFSEEIVQKTADCASRAGKWARLCGEKAGEILKRLHAPRALILSAAELASYKKGQHIVSDVASLRHTETETFFDFLNEEESRSAWEDAKKNGVPMQIGELCIDGSELERMGFRGREIGILLQNLFAYAIENPANNNKERLREVATWMYRQKYLQKE
ncbi:MAG: hypothetical protein E7390_08285 [Ruminococcaceae bacterium]|nr:hypothetical protein [Oscillospiraceae bacterium]